MVTNSNGGDQHMKHDPKLVHCQCGYCFRPGLWHKMVMLVTGKLCGEKVSTLSMSDGVEIV